MASYSDIVVDDYRRPIPDAAVSLFSKDGQTAIAQTKTDVYGRFAFVALDGVYVLETSYGGVVERSSIIIGSPAQFIGPPGGQGLPGDSAPPVPFDVAAYVYLGTSNQAASLEQITAWGQIANARLDFQISFTARDKSNPNGALTLRNLSFQGNGITRIPLLGLDAINLPSDTKAFLEGDTISFESAGAPVDWQQIGDPWSVRLSGTVPVLL